MSQIEFDSCHEREVVFQKGMEKWKRGEVTQEALELGALHREVIHSGFLPEVSVHWVGEEVGYGLFLEEPLLSDCFVGEYTGIVRKNDRRYFEPLNNYCFEYPVPDSIGRSYVVDATAGNLTRFMNHSDLPNVKPIHVFIEGFYHLIFMTLRPLNKGEQLTYDYGNSYWYLRGRPEPL